MKQSYISTNRSAKLQTICNRCNLGNPGYNPGTRAKSPFSVHFAVFRLFSPVPALYVHLLSVSAVKILSAVSSNNLVKRTMGNYISGRPFIIYVCARPAISQQLIILLATIKNQLSIWKQYSTFSFTPSIP